ncbi:peptide/nickel transport system ATP-binding protein [Anaerosporobacter mobilis DSM 15930]|jgi:peptide/nickel transport system ATP-binding protein|uniref:Nickel import system ATP-binding protein NikD n=1 Tax=Anaerosporobacter mobilis DSM 15930 TaxID=1120996 RepID=A0A1M7IE30_9FIRM|nr:peptide/nickel transport system ATP-binding protein [Anaerosporobacter mobilis DSM 15930]
MNLNHIKSSTLLEIDNLSLSFQMYKGFVEQQQLEVISNLSVTVHSGEILAIVGSSGSGKSLLAHAILGILPENATIKGTLRYKDRILTSSYQEELRGEKLALVPQSVSYLDPLMKISGQVIGHKDKSKRKLALKNIFKRLELEEKTENMFPFQLSGGMARRVLVATAVIGDAELIIADEPTPGMQTDQALEALAIFRKLADEGKGIILITHDIDLALNFADNVAIFYAGTTLEITPPKDFLDGEHALRHPYSKALYRAMPQNGFTPLAGLQPYAGTITKGCPFAPRCAECMEQCKKEIPPMRKLRDGYVRCYYAT